MSQKSYTTEEIIRNDQGETKTSTDANFYSYENRNYMNIGGYYSIPMPSNHSNNNEKKF